MIILLAPPKVLCRWSPQELARTGIERPIIVTATCSDRDRAWIDHHLGPLADRILYVSDYSASSLLLLRLASLVESLEVEQVIALSEVNVLRAAHLRGRLGLPGMTVGEALLLRDKWKMKQAAVAAGITCAPHVLVHDPLALQDAARSLGFPVVVKPPMGRGSSGVKVLSNPEALEAFVEDHPWNDMGYRVPLLVEAFVQGDLCRVDGVFHNGRPCFVTAARYWGTHLDYLGGGCLGSVMLDPAQPLAQRLTALTCRLLGEVLPFGPSGGFHVELFAHPSGELVFSEAAARLGGGSIMEEIECATGVNIKTLAVAAEAGQDQAVAEILSRQHESFRSAAQLHISPRPLTLSAVPERCPHPRVALYEVMGETGCDYGLMSHTNAEIARFVLSGDGGEDLTGDLSVLVRWFNSHTRWSA